MTSRPGAIRADAPTKRTRVFTGAHLMFPGEIDAWAGWFRRLGVDPNGVALPGMVIADDENRTLSWLEYARDDQGRIRLNAARTSAEHTERTMQLEGPAPTFPDDEPGWPYG